MARIGETADQRFDNLTAGPRSNQVELATRMVKALRRWLEANELFAIITAVAGTLLVLSMLLVLGGYLFVTR
jgi:hypothetical protein